MAENQNPNPQPPQPPAPQPQHAPAAAPQVIGNTPIANPAVPSAPPPPGADQLLPHSAGTFGENGMLTHAGMVRTIRGGGSVNHNGTIIAREQDLPSPAELAQRDTQHAQALLADAKQRNDHAGIARAERLLNSANAGTQQTTADLDRQIAALQQQRSAIAAQPDKAKK